MILSNLKMSSKILLLIGILGAVCAGITLISVNSMSALSDATDTIDITAREIRLGARIDRLILELNREEYRLGSDPGEFEAVAGTVAEKRALILQDLEDAKGMADAEQARMLAAVEAALATYAANLDDTLAIAERRRSEVEVSDAAREILRSVASSRDEADRLVDNVTTYVAYTDDKGTTASTQASAMADSRMTLVMVMAAGGILAGLVLGWAISQYGIVRPIRAIVACLRGLADGNLSVEIYGVARKDEVGEIAGTASVFKDNLIRTREMEREAEEAEARAQAERRRATLELADSFERRVGTIVDAVGGAATELQATAAQLAAAVEEVNAQSSSVAAASEQASTGVQTVASAAEEMSAAIGELSERINAAAGQSRTAAEGAGMAQREMDALAGAIEQVDQIVASINAVAEQTNLLALNATIEAARAGDAGKGFAVVASEVKNLANQTRTMTDEIGNQIAAVKAASAKGVQAMRTIIGQVAEISTSSTEMAASVEQQSAATTEISRNAQQAAVGTSEVSANVTGIQQAGVETGSASNNVKQAAGGLAEQSAMLKMEVDAFLREVRAA